MLKKSTILVGAGIIVALILGIYGLAPLFLEGGTQGSAAVASEGDGANRAMLSSERGANGEDDAAVSTTDGSSVSDEANGEGGTFGNGAAESAAQTGSGVKSNSGASPGSSSSSTNSSNSGGSGSDAGSGSAGSGVNPNSGSSSSGSSSSSNSSNSSNANSGGGSSSSGPAQLSCTLSINCSTILNNLDKLRSGKRNLVPSGGVIMAARTASFTEGETVFDVLRRETQNSGIHMEFMTSPVYGSAYIEGINNLYEFDCGDLSGWMYCVNGWYPNYGCSQYTLHSGDVIQWNYTCDLGRDLGAERAVLG
jgi:hypothetical protein